MPRTTLASLRVLNQEITACRLCPRLTRYREQVANDKRRAFRDWDYWGKPVPGFGDPAARLLIVGLAPAAHGANRTGRIFTGDRSGDFLFRALHLTGFASQAQSVSKDDGLVLKDAYITSPVRCAPPDNKPAPAEFHACQSYLEREIDFLKDVEVVVALGGVAFHAYLSLLRRRGGISKLSLFRFAHNSAHRTANHAPVLIGSYHPSQQNTSTGRLTLAMLTDVFARAARLIHG